MSHKIIPSHWGYKMVTGPWETVSHQTGWIDDIVQPGLNKQLGVHNISDKLRYSIASKTKLRPRSSPTGFAGAAVIAALIDGITQLISDAELCLSPMQRANRVALSLILALAAGTAAGLAFAAGVSLTVGASLLVAATVPVLLGLAAGYGASIVANKLKETWFTSNPHWFGSP